MTSSSSSQTGTFSVEFALIAAVLVPTFLFAVDTVVKLSVQGNLDRLSYSLVNILKERTQLYGKNDYELTNARARQLLGITESALSRTMSNYNSQNLGSQFEMLSFDSDGDSVTTVKRFNGGCSSAGNIRSHESLSMKTSWGRKATLYRVTLCYNVNNYSLVDGSDTLSSSSIVMGR